MSTYIPTPDYGYSAPDRAIPAPDYTSQNRNQAPTNMIPPPDYVDGRPFDPQIDYDKTVRYSNSRYSQRRNLPNFNNNNLIYRSGTEIKPEAIKHIQPATTFVEEKVHVPARNEALGQHRNYPSALPEDNFVAHSYLEDRNKIWPDDVKNKSIRSHIRNIGVPVLPGIMSDTSPSDELVDISPAFLRHLENHKSFDTMRSLRSCRLCVMMAKEGLIDIETGALLNHVSTGNTKVRKDVRDLFEQQEDEGSYTRARRSYTRKHEGEMSVEFREKIQIIRSEGTHVLCKRADETLGWLPNYVVQ